MKSSPTLFLTIGFLLGVIVGLIPYVAAVPAIQDPSTSTVLVDGTAGDRISFADGFASGVGTSVVITAPDGQSLRGVRTSQANPSTNTQGVYLNNVNFGSNHWTYSGTLQGAKADGTWTITFQGLLYTSQSTSTPASGNGPAVVLTVAGKSAVFGVSYASPGTEKQFWNWHQTAAATTWTEPSTSGLISPATIDPPNEAADEDPNLALFFQPTAGSTIPLAATGGSTITCPIQVAVDGSWVRGATQTGNTFVRFVLVEGIISGDTDLRDNVGASFSALTDDGAGATGSETDTFPVGYNNAAGNTYQFLARSGATGMEVLGQPVFVAPMQCTITPPAVIGIPNIHDVNTMQITASQAQCNGDAASFELKIDLGGIHTVVAALQVYYYDSDTGALIDTTTTAGMNIIATNAIYHWVKLFPTGGYVVVALLTLTGVGSDLFFDAATFNVPRFNCGPTDLTPVIVGLDNMTDYLDHINNHLHLIDVNINFTRGEILDALDNLNITITGNLTVNNETLTLIYNTLVNHTMDPLGLNGTALQIESPSIAQWFPIWMGLALLVASVFRKEGINYTHMGIAGFLFVVGSIVSPLQQIHDNASAEVIARLITLAVGVYCIMEYTIMDKKAKRAAAKKIPDIS